MSSEVNEVNVSADSVFICVKITYWVRVRRPRQATAPTYSKNAAPLDQPPLPRKNPRSAPGTISFFNMAYKMAISVKIPMLKVGYEIIIAARSAVAGR